MSAQSIVHARNHSNYALLFSRNACIYISTKTIPNTSIPSASKPVESFRKKRRGKKTTKAKAAVIITPLILRRFFTQPFLSEVVWAVRKGWVGILGKNKYPCLPV